MTSTPNRYDLGFLDRFAKHLNTDRLPFLKQIVTNECCNCLNTLMAINNMLYNYCCVLN
ncbi:hypothetical protein EJK54_0932 [Moraxella catarrhalis]|uniref:Uncharacterized protein n=1 Tax=Moraxella catarrhalis TaxID=480 RepID=A0A3Q9GC49_MORCA|nr:hypothetical protein EJK53_0123 [Moraxella catarrhalis]RUO14199.1 hypothetical protein EJK49_1324 [Moraxella catarrhalis]RUO16108.1 hypothetical protein EJK54_0932 [Moraxella catarrhalis]